jgi:uroporphyrinogen-III synthase
LAQVLPAWGVAPTQIDAPANEAEQFDSEALWAVVQSQVRPGHTVVIVGGGAGREWLTQRCQAAGATVHRCEAYARQAPEPSSDWLAQLALARQAAGVWLFSSGQAIEHLALLAPQSDWSGRTAVVTHPRIAAAARALGFDRVCLSRPTVADVLKTLESQDHDR